MSLRLKPDGKKNNKFDTIELIPDAKNYGAPSKSAKRSLPSFAEENNGNVETVESPDSGKTTDDLGEYNSGHEDAEEAHTPLSGPQKGPDFAARDDKEIEENEPTKAPKKFGTLDGVFGRCLLCMWGVIMFLRTGWIVGNAGIWQATMVMVLSASITMFTTLSLSAICTNGQISHGGPYFLISRSLGPNLGGVIGLVFAMGNCVGVALHLVGFAEAIESLYTPKTFFGGWDIVFYAEIGLVVLFVISLRGVGCIIKFNLFLLFLMFVSIIAFFVGTFIPTSAKTDFGYTGYSTKTFATNWGPAYLPGNNFLTMVAIFFPSVTGCMAGANISGDLKNPAVNIPVGTIGAVIFSMVVYVIIAWMLGACVDREIFDSNGDHIINAGLYHNYVIMSDISLWRPLVDIGIYASTFSSATSCFVAAPRIFKAVCDDGLFPVFAFFAVGRKSDNEPIRCYVLVVIVCALIMLSGDINFIAPLVTNFFLITYALVNYSVFAWDISKSPGWRPSFKYYSPYLSLFATFQAVGLMFLIDWIMALITALIGFVCYKYIEQRDVNTNWGTTVESKLYLQGCKIALKYQHLNTDHAKISRPTFLIMHYKENKDDVIELFNLAKFINYSQGLILIGHVLLGDLHSDVALQKKYTLKRKFQEYDDLSPDILKQCIMECCTAESYESGTESVIQMAGMGGMQPNVFVMKIDEKNLKINQENLSSSKKQPLWFTNLRTAMLSGLGIIMVPNDFSIARLVDDPDPDDQDITFVSQLKNHVQRTRKISEGGNDNKTIDIWWLFDDGGLTILCAHLLTKHKYFKNYKLRIMALDEIGFEDHTAMVALMQRLRIKAEIEPVKAIDDAELDDIDQSLDRIIIEQNTQRSAEQPPAYEDIDGDAAEQKEVNHEATESDAAAMEALRNRTVSQFAREKIRKYRRVGKTIEKYSQDAKLCLLTMPYPRVKFEWFEYGQIIHDLTPKDIPTIFVRGTQEQVLTFCF